MEYICAATHVDYRHGAPARTIHQEAVKREQISATIQAAPSVCGRILSPAHGYVVFIRRHHVRHIHGRPGAWRLSFPVRQNGQQCRFPPASADGRPSRPPYTPAQVAAFSARLLPAESFMPGTQGGPYPPLLLHHAHAPSRPPGVGCYKAKAGKHLSEPLARSRIGEFPGVCAQGCAFACACSCFLDFVA